MLYSYGCGGRGSFADVKEECNCAEDVEEAALPIKGWVQLVTRATMRRGAW